MDKQITLDFTKLSVVDINQVRPNSWNPKDKDTKEFADVKASIQENGLRGFIVVRDNPSDGSLYEIIDGEQRWRACSELGFEKVVIYNEGAMDNKKAQELTLWWQVQVQFNELSLAKMITGMISEFGVINSPYSEKRIQEMKELAQFNFDNYKQTSTTPPPPSGELLQTFMVQLTTSQFEVVNKALEKARKASEMDISNGRALEFIAIEYLNAPDGTVN